MPRLVYREVVVDTSFFTALQLQPRVLLAQAFNALAAWYKQHLVPFPALMREHRVGTVILAIEIRYGERLHYYDGDTLQIESGLRLRRNATRLEQQTIFRGAGRLAATVRVVLCPVSIEEERSLSAAPAPLPPELVGRFRPEEIDDTPPARGLPALVETVQASDPIVAEGAHGFRIAHHHCEMAEQWAFLEVPTFVESSREELAMAQRGRVPALKRSLAEPLRALDIELYRPYFIFDRGRVHTRAFGSADRLAFLHELRAGDGRAGDGGAGDGGARHGVVVERY